MLGRSERESGPHARQAATAAGWAATPEDLLELGTTSSTLATVATIADVAAVVHLGHPAQPSHDLERALLAAPPQVAITAATSIAPDWVWVGTSASTSGTVVVDEAGMRDCRHALRAMGLSPRLVPTRTSLAERVAFAGPDGSLVIERSEVPAGYHELAGSERLAERSPLWYGLVQAGVGLQSFDRPAQVWLAFGPRDDHRGSLQQTLGVIAAAGIDMQHLRSLRSQAGPHFFFSSFTCSDSGLLSGLLEEFGERGVSQRVLAVIPGERFLPGPDALDPRWSR